MAKDETEKQDASQSSQTDETKAPPPEELETPVRGGIYIRLKSGKLKKTEVTEK